ncbi:hypothetical protein LguiA_022758 [Lonicera macranthoides]
MKKSSLINYVARKLLSSLHSPSLSSSNWRYYSSSSLPSSSNSSPPPNNKLFVAGLSWSVDEKSLQEAFSSFGEVTEVRIMYDKETGRSRGFGFVNFSKENDASCAKDAMDRKAFLGRPLRISFALEKVRGGPMVVPRLTNIGNAGGWNN